MGTCGLPDINTLALRYVHLYQAEHLCLSFNHILEKFSIISFDVVRLSIGKTRSSEILHS